jgi:RNA polymerase sigma-70 factor (ECF subfamily)
MGNQKSTSTSAEEFGKIFQEHSKAIYDTIKSLIKDPHLRDDLLQDTFIKASGKIDSYTEQGTVRAWLQRIAYNLCIDHFRSECRNPLTFSSSLNQDSLDILDTAVNIDYVIEMNREYSLVKNETVKSIHEAIRCLGSDQKEVILLRYYGNLTYKKIAIVIDASINTVMGRNRYALNHIRKSITAESKQVA